MGVHGADALNISSDFEGMLGWMGRSGYSDVTPKTRTRTMSQSGKSIMTPDFAMARDSRTRWMERLEVNGMQIFGRLSGQKLGRVGSKGGRASYKCCQ